MNISNTAKVVIALIALFFSTIILTFFWGVGVRNDFVAKEKAIEAQYKDNQSNYDSMWKKFRETAKVTSMYAEDVEKIYKGAITGRYGENGSQAVVQMLREHNPNIDGSMYKKLQEIIEAGRDTFAEKQTRLLDLKRAYETQLDTFPKNIIAGFSGFPRIDLAKFDIVTSDRTSNAFETKKDEEIELR